MLKIYFTLHSPDGSDGGTAATVDSGLPAAPTVAELQSKLDAANRRIADLESQQATQTEDEKLIVAKMSMGLTRSQATNAVRRQKQYDESPAAKERAGRKPGESTQDRNRRAARIFKSEEKK